MIKLVCSKRTQRHCVKILSFDFRAPQFQLPFLPLLSQNPSAKTLRRKSGFVHHLVRPRLTITLHTNKFYACLSSTWTVPERVAHNFPERPRRNNNRGAKTIACSRFPSSRSIKLRFKSGLVISCTKKLILNKHALVCLPKRDRTCAQKYENIL